MIRIRAHEGRLEEEYDWSPFEKLLVVQTPPLLMKPKLERAEAEAREEVEADAEAKTRRSTKVA